MQRSEYKNTFAISQSAIKAFKTKTIQKFKKIYIDKIEEDEDNTKFAFGSLVDTTAFTPKLLDERFYIPEREIEIPGEKVKIVLDKVYKEAKEININIDVLNKQGNLPEKIHSRHLPDLYEWQDLILKYANEIGYGGSTWSPTRKKETILDAGTNYFSSLAICNGRQIINAIDNTDAISVVESLRSNSRTTPYFVEQPDETLLFQQEIFVDFMGTPLKGALDIIRFKHKEKIVIVPDLKTTHSSEKFEGIAKSFDYVNQASFYRFLIKLWLKTYNSGKYSDYSIETPINIVIDRNYKIPYIYEYDERDLEISEYGSKEHNVNGWQNDLREIAWHIETNSWDMPKELYETGKIKLKIFR